MSDEIPATHELDDAKLLNLVRAGDPAAFSVLYQRHEQAARRLARDLVVSPAEIDDVVAETFDRVLDVVMRGGGPTDAFRPYVLAAVRRLCYDRLQGHRMRVPADQQWMPDPGQPFFDTAGANPDRSPITGAFLSLPERWRGVLWHLEIERSSAAEVAPIFGLTRNGVAALRRRARDGLRQAYLQMYMSGVTRQACKPVAARLGAFVRDSSSKRDTTMVSEHLSECDECRAVCAELSDINGALRSVVAPIFLGSAAASYLATAVDGAEGAAGTAGAAAAIGAAGAGAGAGGGLAGGTEGAAGAEGAAAGGAIGVGGFHGVTGTVGVGGDSGAAAWGAGHGGGTQRSGGGSGSGGDSGGASGMAGILRSSNLVRWFAGAAAAIVAVFAVAFAVTLTGNRTPTGPGHHPQAGPTLPLTLSTPAQPQTSLPAKSRAGHNRSTSPSQAPSSASVAGEHQSEAGRVIAGGQPDSVGIGVGVGVGDARRDGQRVRRRGVRERRSGCVPGDRHGFGRHRGTDGHDYAACRKLDDYRWRPARGRSLRSQLRLVLPAELRRRVMPAQRDIGGSAERRRDLHHAQRHCSLRPACPAHGGKWSSLRQRAVDAGHPLLEAGAFRSVTAH